MIHELYHGTLSSNVASILSIGLTAGSLASDPAFAWTWKEDAVIEVKIPDEIFNKLLKAARLGSIPCAQYTIPNGLVIPNQFLRVMSTDELQVHKDYAESRK